MGSFFLVGGRPYAVATPAAPVPVAGAGADAITNGTMELDSNWSDDNTPTTNERSNAQAHAGTYSRRVVSTGGYRGIIQSGRAWTSWMILRYYAYIVDRNRLYLTVADGDGTILTDTARVLGQGAWAQDIYSFRAASAAAGGNVRFRDVGESVEFFIDDVSVVSLTLSSLISASLYASADVDLSVAATRTANTQAGFAARVDNPSSPANFLLAYLDGANNVKLDKCVAGVYTNLVSGAVTYGASKLLRLLCSGTSVSVFYDGTQVGATQTVSDAGIVDNLYHGLFSTYASNSFTDYTASSWVAVTP